jgi:hypothetical protein
MCRYLPHGSYKSGIKSGVGTLKEAAEKRDFSAASD